MAVAIPGREALVLAMEEFYMSMKGRATIADVYTQARQEARIEGTFKIRLRLGHRGLMQVRQLWTNWTGLYV